MSWPERVRGTVRRLSGHFAAGATVTIRRNSTLVDPDTSEQPATLAVNGTTASGSTTITLDASSLIGTMAKGSTFTIAGDGTTYTTTAAVTAASNALTNVPINALQAEAADDAVVTLVDQGGEFTAPAFRRGFRSDEYGDAIAVGDWKLVIATDEEIEDYKKATITYDGDKVNVIGILPHSPGATQGAVVLHCRG